MNEEIESLTLQLELARDNYNHYKKLMLKLEYQLWEALEK